MSTRIEQSLKIRLSIPDMMSLLGKGAPRLGKSLIETSSSNLSGEQYFLNDFFLDGRKWGLDEEKPAAVSINETLHEIVKGYARENKKVGLLLSGGFDSTVLASLLSHYTKDVVCYTFRYPEFDQVNEINFSQYVAQRFKFKLKVVNIDYDRYLHLVNEVLNQSVQKPLITWTVVTQLAISRAAIQDGCDFMLSGLGSDEIFGGFSKMGGIYKDFKKSNPKTYWDDIFDKSKRPESVPIFVGNISPFPYTELERLFPHTFSTSYIEDDVIDLYQYLHNQLPESDISPFMSFLEVIHRLGKILIPDFKLAEQITGLPVYYPYLHKKILRRFLHLPLELRWKFTHEGSLKYFPKEYQGIDKYILRLAFQKEVPSRIHSRVRMAYTTPFAWWIKEPGYLDFIYNLVIRSEVWNMLQIDKEELNKLFDLQEYQPDLLNQWQRPFQIWMIYAISVWFDKMNPI